MITILMATYNGARYLAEQINSLLSQTEQGFVLHIQDDRSTDETDSILHAYAAKYPEKIFVHTREQNSGGAKWNFLDLMVNFPDDYVMLCDQDDVWLPNKIALTLQAMQRMENEFGAETPILVHTDLTVVDESLNTIAESLNRMLDLRMEYGILSSQTVQNTVTGCTAMYNRALAQRIRIPRACIVHDWWLGMMAVCFGKKEYIPDKTLFYRQHGANSIGAKNVVSLSYIAQKMLRPKKIREQLDATYQQAEEFLHVYSDLLSAEQQQFLRAFISIPSHRKIRRWLMSKRLGTLKHGFIRRLAQFLYI